MRCCTVAQFVCWVLGKLTTDKPNPRATENNFETYSLQILHSLTGH